MKQIEKHATWLLGLAGSVACRSKDTTQVGALLVADDTTVLLTAFNGPLGNRIVGVLLSGSADFSEAVGLEFYGIGVVKGESDG